MDTAASASHPVPFAALTPKDETGAAAFAAAHPNFDGRGVVIAILDTGVDPAVDGLRVCPDGSIKVVDMVDASGSGDVQMADAASVAANGTLLQGATGRLLTVNAAWVNPTGKWKIGAKFAYELFPAPLVQRVKASRSKAWEKANNAAYAAELAGAAVPSDAHGSTLDGSKRGALLKETAGSVEDRGPLLDVVAWHDGAVWRAAVDGSATGDMRSAPGLTNYATELKYGVLDDETLLTYAMNIYEEGRIVSVVTDAGSHGTHVAGISAAYFPTRPDMNGVAPAAKIVSIKIGDTRLGSMETSISLVRALKAIADSGAHVVNMSYGEPSARPAYGRFMELATHLIREKGVVFVSSAGNNGPALTTVGAPGGTHTDIIGVAAVHSQAMQSDQYVLRRMYKAAGGAESAEEDAHTFQRGAVAVHDRALDGSFTWSSRGPTHDGALGVCVCAPGAAITTIPRWNLAPVTLMNGTSMSSPNAAGCIALLLSACKQEGVPFTPASLRRALQCSSRPLRDDIDEASDVFATGYGMIYVPAAFAHLQLQAAVAHARAGDAVETAVADMLPCLDVCVPQGGASVGEGGDRGIYMRDCAVAASDYNVTVTPWMREGTPGSTKADWMERVSLRVTGAGGEWISTPERLVLTHSGRSFSVHVDASRLRINAVHHAEVQGMPAFSEDVASNAAVNNALRALNEQRKSGDVSLVDAFGPLFRVPVTVIRSVAPSCGPAGCIAQLHDGDVCELSPGVLIRRFLRVPTGATWAEVRISRLDSGHSAVESQTVDDASSRMVIVHAVQVLRQVSDRHTCAERYMQLRPRDEDIMTFTVQHDATLEVVLGQYWSTLGRTHVSGTITFRGVSVEPSIVHLDAVTGVTSFTATPLLHDVVVKPVARLTHARVRVPISSVEGPFVLPPGRDTLVNGEPQCALQAKYKMTGDGASVKFSLDRVQGALYESPWEAAIITVQDSVGRLVGTSDTFPSSITLPASGDVTIRLQVRSTSAARLDKLKAGGLTLWMTRALKDACTVRVCETNAAAVTSGDALTSKRIRSGETLRLFMQAPALDAFKGVTLTAGDSVTGTLLLEDYAAPGVQASLPKESRSGDAPLYSGSRNPRGHTVVFFINNAAAAAASTTAAASAEIAPGAAASPTELDVSKLTAAATAGTRDLLLSMLKALRPHVAADAIMLAALEPSSSTSAAGDAHDPVRALAAVLQGAGGDGNAGTLLTSAVKAMLSSSSMFVPACRELLEALEASSGTPRAFRRAAPLFDATTGSLVPTPMVSLPSRATAYAALWKRIRDASRDACVYMAMKHDEAAMSAEQKKAHAANAELQKLFMDASVKYMYTMSHAVQASVRVGAGADIAEGALAAAVADVADLLTSTSSAFQEVYDALALLVDMSALPYSTFVLEAHLRAQRWHAALTASNKMAGKVNGGSSVLDNASIDCCRAAICSQLGTSWTHVLTRLQQTQREGAVSASVPNVL